MKLISLLPLNLREAEKEEKPADDAEGTEENPFAGADDTGGGEEGSDAAADGEKDSEEKGGEEQSTDNAKPLDVVFNPAKVRKYNDVSFKDNKGTVVNISRFGLTVKLPDEQTILVNFDDVL